LRIVAVSGQRAVVKAATLEHLLNLADEFSAAPFVGDGCEPVLLVATRFFPGGDSVFFLGVGLGLGARLLVGCNVTVPEAVYDNFYGFVGSEPPNYSAACAVLAEAAANDTVATASR
jgi:hypothetical protein